MRKTYLITAILFFICAPLALGEDVDLSKYRYQRDVTVDCGNFLGYAKIEVDTDLSSKSRELKNIYIDSEHYIEFGFGSEKKNWFVKDSNIGDIESLKAILDRNKESYHVVSSPQSSLDLDLKNPSPQAFDKIVITLKDSELNEVRFYKNNEKLMPKVIKDNFEYTYLFDKKITTDNIRVQILFDNILKVAEIEFLDVNYKPTIYLFVDDECSRVYKMYYGDFGGNFVTSKRHDSGKILTSALSEERLNPDYNPDFDGDSVLNEDDNCLSIKNQDQKDINYNGIGDACEDFDNDRVINSEDNCPDDHNPHQLDIDKDSIGDACDSEDNRLSEQNKWFFYVLAILIVALFGFMGCRLFRKK